MLLHCASFFDVHSVVTLQALPDSKFMMCPSNNALVQFTRLIYVVNCEAKKKWRRMMIVVIFVIIYRVLQI